MQWLWTVGMLVVIITVLLYLDRLADKRNAKVKNKRHDVGVHLPAPLDRRTVHDDPSTSTGAETARVHAPTHCCQTPTSARSVAPAQADRREKGPGPLPTRPDGPLFIVALSDNASKSSASNAIPYDQLITVLTAAIDVLESSPTATLHVAPSFDLRIRNLTVSRDKRLLIDSRLRPRINGVHF